MKKKKNTLYIRKQRKRSTNKRKLLTYESYNKMFKYYFYTKFRRKLNFNFTKFLKFFHFADNNRIYRYI